MGDRATGGHDGVAWRWGNFKILPLKWCILVRTFYNVLHSQLAWYGGAKHWDGEL